jgi:poly(3-hydroxybutyrate) depolymerase
MVLGLLSLGMVGCSSSSDGGGGSGGKTSAGGSSGNGGSGAGGTSSAGGSKATGGSMSSGGAVSTGGSGSGGASHESGGAPGTGGSNAGGSKATGGSSSDAAAAGGSASDASAKGGAGGGTSVGTGGGTSAGTGGSGNGGSTSTGTGTGGSGAGGSTGGKTSPGCGSASPLKTSNSFTESIDGTTRKWMLDVPTNYDTNKPYKMIFVWHPLGGSGSQVVSGGYNGLKSLSNGTAIFATADGLQGSNSETSGVGWWNKNGGDMKLFKAMLDKINAGLCVDQERIFSTGFSFGGMMSYTLPFEFDVFRAVAPCSGKTGVIPYDEKFTGPVAIMAFHGDNDTFVATNLGKAFFDKFAARNKCGTQTQAVSPNGCNQYQGCSVPSTWCLFKGGHETWSEEPAAIWKFFSSF